MAGFETVVRPVVFPDTRPAPARTLPSLDNSETGFVVIRGNGAKQVDVAHSYSLSTSTSRTTEVRRRVDVARVYQQDDHGNVNRDTYVDIEVANKIWKNQGKDLTTDYYRRIKESDNVEIKQKNQIRENV